MVRRPTLCLPGVARDGIHSVSNDGQGVLMRRPQFDKKYNANFINDTINQDLLDCAVVWIGDNLTPGDVFNTQQLEDWAYDAGFKRFE